MALENTERLSLPIVDLSSWFNHESSTPEQRQSSAKQLVEACQSVGFVYIINHGVSPELLEEAFSWSKRLFDLKLEDKMQAPHPDGSAVHRGYSWPGLEKVSQVMLNDGDATDAVDKARQVTDCKESYEIGSEDNPTQPNVWLPEATFPGFRSFMTKFYWECWSTAREVLRAIGAGLELPDDGDYLLNFHSGHNNQLRLLHYPPIPAKLLESQSSARMPAHTDWGSITMLFQDSCGGLEVQSGDSVEFVKAHPMTNAIVMNVGDLLQRWSNDRLKSTMHRVTLPPLEDRFEGAERLTRARYSIPYFISPDVDSVIECLPSCTDEDHPVKYPPVVQKEYRLMRARSQYPSTSVEPAAP